MLLSKTQTVFASQLEESIVERRLTSPARPAREQNCFNMRGIGSMANLIILLLISAQQRAQQMMRLLL